MQIVVGHRDVRTVGRLADLVDRADVRMPQAGRGPRLAQEPLPALRVEPAVGQGQLDRHDAPQQPMPGAKHNAHAAPAEHLEHVVPRNLRQRRMLGSPLAAAGPGLRPIGVGIGGSVSTVGVVDRFRLQILGLAQGRPERFIGRRRTHLRCPPLVVSLDLATPTTNGILPPRQPVVEHMLRGVQVRRQRIPRALARGSRLCPLRPLAKRGGYNRTYRAGAVEKR